MNSLARTALQIGNAIRRSRRRLAWSQKVLGEKAGLRQATISVLESGHPRARIESLLAVLASLGLEFQIAPRSKSSRQQVERLL